MKMNYNNINSKLKEKNEKFQIEHKVIQDLIQKEFIDSCEKILIENKPKFIEDYFKRINLIIKNYYGEEIFQRVKSLNKIIHQNKIGFINNIYFPMFKLCSLAIKLYNSKTINSIENPKILFLKNYRPHCMSSENNNNLNVNDTAIHYCGGNLLIISENSNNNNNNINIANNTFIICTKCKKSYFPISIPMLCCYCHSFYYSEVIPENIKNNNCYLATWSKYHCKNINNEKMSCIKCGEPFWLKNNKLFCKKCKFEIEPNNIIWTCLICNSDFNSNAKIYNPLEFKEAQLILKEAFLYKKIVKPIELPCKCISNESQIEQIHFFHRIKNNTNTNINKNECKGLLYFNEINNKKFIVCSLCLNIYSMNKFKWICPICYKSFTTSKIKIFYLKEKNNNINTIYKNKKININDNNNNNPNLKESSKKKQRVISILDTENSYNSINNDISNNNFNKITNQNSKIYLSPNKNDLNNYKIRNANSYIKKQPKDLNKISACYSSSSKDLQAKNNNNRINNKTISNNISFNNNNGIRKKIHNKIRKNNTINNGCLYSLNIKKRRNLSEIPNELKSEIYFLMSKNNKHENKYNSGTGSTIFSSLSNYNLNSPKETIIKTTIDQNINNSNNRTMKTVENNNTINNKKIINNVNNFNLHKNKKNNINDNEKNSFCYKSKKRNILINNNFNDIYQKKINNNNNNKEIIKIKNNNINYYVNNINTINNEINCKIINNNLLSPKNYKKLDFLKNIENKNDCNNENIFHKKLNKRQKGHKSFYIKDKKFILFSPENQVRNNKNGHFNSKNIFKINDIQLENKQKIPHKELNIIKNFNKNRNNLNKKKEELDYFNNSLNKKEYIKYNINNSLNFNNNNNNINNLTINNNNSNSKYNLNHNNSINSDYNLKRKKNTSFEKINKSKIKNINISIASPKINNNNYNLSFSTELKNILLNKRKINTINNISINSKISSKENISNSQTNNSNNNENDNSNNNKLKKFNFDDYTIITQLGQGSFGKIYLVKDSNENIYSMKKILLSEELDVKSVLDEYNMCYNLSHPNIIKIIGVYSNKLDKTTYVVYVLMEVGISDWEKEINSYKAKQAFYSESDLINILKQLISSLSFLQKKNISHRDIKPQNILIFKNKIYKLTDFGEARKIIEKDKNNKSSAQYSLKGTELYMSPLLFNGLRTGQIDIKHNTYKSDVYSLGLCLLYAATTNEKTLFEIRRIIEMDKIKKYIYYVLKDKYSDKLIDIISIMLELYEEKRPDFIELENIIVNY